MAGMFGGQGGQGGEGGAGIGVGIGVGGKGGNATATIKKGAVVNNVNPSATIEKGAVKNINTSKSAVVNSGNVVDSGNSKSKSDLTLTQIYEDKRDHITGPAILKSDAKLSNGRVDRIKLFGLELLDKITQLTQAQADKLASQASDIKVEKALIFENAFELDKIKFGKAGEFMGYLYVLSDGTDCNAAAMIGKVSRAAMKAGATHIELVRVSSADHATGSAWNVGIGGGASIMSNSETVAIAPNGGLGFGKAKASNEARPSLAFGAYFDKNLLTTSYRIVKKDLGYSAEDK